ncbi:Gfo/Idh/MocA family protein [Streptomyces ovatisporus]|uniref:Gfo/Idh/MocA family protein n=1 Tax=Streptomyces ovatisporus TaxID=1128682 RepID=A0ABV9AH10_9ACTN
MTDDRRPGHIRTRPRLAVAGLGAIARTAHLPLLERRRDLFEVTALCDLSRSALDELGTRYGIPAEHRHTSTASLLGRGGFDAVLLLTSGSHGDDAEAALRAGYAVLCEKPLACTRAEAARVAAAEREQGRGPRLMVGYMKQYDPAAVRLAQLLEQAGGAADVRSVEVCVLHPAGEAQLEFAHLPAPVPDADPEALSALRARNAELTAEALGPDAPGPVRDLYDTVNSSVCHEFSLLRSFIGSPASVDFAAHWPGKAAGPGSLELSGRLPGPARYSIRWHYLPGHAAYRETVAVHHEGGTLELAFPSPYLMNAATVLTATDNVGGTEMRAEYRSVVEAFEQELVAFHAMVTRGRPPRTGVSGATEDLVTAQRAAARFAELAQLPCAGEASSA